MRRWLLLGCVAGACTSDPALRSPTPQLDAGAAPIPDAAPAPADAGPTDAATPEPDAALAKLTVYPRRGAAADDVGTPAGPALALDSGASEVLEWMQSAIFPGQAGRGDLVVLTAAGGDGAASYLAAGGFHSVQTLSLADDPVPADYAAAARILDRAEGVWFEGGDQAKYVRWQGSPLLAAVQRVYDRGGVVAGLSAGMIILGSAVNDALLTVSENLTTARLLANPFDPELHFTQSLFTFPPLTGTITDPHFSAQDRMGRLATFVARQVTGPAGYRGIAVDNGAAFGIAQGVGRRIGSGGSVYIARGGVPERLVAGQPLRYALTVHRLATAEHSYDLANDCGTALVYALTVDGAAAPPYSTDPYTSGTLASTCP